MTTKQQSSAVESSTGSLHGRNIEYTATSTEGCGCRSCFLCGSGEAWEGLFEFFLGGGEGTFYGLDGWQWLILILRPVRVTLLQINVKIEGIKELRNVHGAKLDQW